MIHKAVIGAGLSLCVAACASSPVTPAAAHPAASRAPAGCVTQTATRIPLRPGDCGAAGHVWTGDALKSTGANEPGQALYLLDPTLPVPSILGKPRMASH
jgi:hypothetical protein